MEALETRIREAERFRDRYYEEHSKATAAEKANAVREVVLPLLQDIPLEIRGSSASSAEYHLICGRILNVISEYDSKCEKHLTDAVKLDPSLGDAWAELGECVWKKGDRQTAIDCFRASLARKRTVSCLCSLAGALREQATHTEAAELRESMREEACKLCNEAVGVDPTSEVAWHALGNSLVKQFFVDSQRDQLLMAKGREAYEKALRLCTSHRNPDLHLNYSTVLKFDQEYAQCLEHLKIACDCDPNFFDAKSRLQDLSLFLIRLGEAVERKGKLKPKRLLEFQKSLREKDSSAYRTLKGGQSISLPEVNFAALKEGPNEGVVVCGKVVGIVPNPEPVPFAYVGCDREGSSLAFTVYNFSNKFGLVIGDTFALPEPYVIHVQVAKVRDEYLKKDWALNFRLVRIPNPMVIMRNGRNMGVQCVAMCDMRTSYMV